MSENLKNSSDIGLVSREHIFETNVGLRLNKIDVDPKYIEKWNIHQRDFVVMTFNGVLLRNTLYRIGGLNRPDPEKDRYFMLLKYVESEYTEKFMKACGDKAPRTKKHLEGVWCIFDKNGIELWENEKGLHSPYLVKDAPIVSLDGKYYNILTKKYLGRSYNVIKSKTFMILDNQNEEDEEIKGVIKIYFDDGRIEKII